MRIPAHLILNIEAELASEFWPELADPEFRDDIPDLADMEEQQQDELITVGLETGPAGQRSCSRAPSDQVSAAQAGVGDLA